MPFYFLSHTEKKRIRYILIIFSFFDNIDRIAAKDYRPTCRDVLLTRVATTGVVKLQFMFKSIEFK